MVLYKLVPQLQSPRQCLFDEDSDDEDEEYEMDASSVSNALEPGFLFYYKKQCRVYEAT